MNSEFNKKQNKKVTIFAIILSAISIGLLVIGFLLVSSDKVVMLQSISNLSSKLEPLLDDNGLYDKIASAKDVGVRTSFNLTSDYANAKLSIDFLENQEDKKSKLAVDFAMNDENLLGLDGVLANDKLYFYVDDITPNYYYTALEYVHVISGLKSNSYDKMLTLLKESVNDSIDNDQIKKEKVEITYNGKKKKVNRLSYLVTNKVISSMITNFVDSLKRDKELLKDVANYIGKTTSEVEQELDNLVKEMSLDEGEFGFYYNVYYYGFNKIVRYEITNKEHQTILEYQVEDKESIHIYDGEQFIFSLEIAKKQKDYEFSGFIYYKEADSKIPFSGNLKDDTLTLVVSQDGIDIKLVIVSTEEIKDNNYVGKSKITLSTKTEGVETLVGTLDIHIEYYFNQKIDIDLSNSVDINEISEEDLSMIQNNIMNHPIYEMISTLTSITDFSL